MRDGDTQCPLKKHMHCPTPTKTPLPRIKTVRLTRPTTHFNMKLAAIDVTQPSLQG